MADKYGTRGTRGEEALRRSHMMAHLLDSMEQGTDIGHYGRLTFIMVARHFIDPDEIVRLLAEQPDQDEQKVRAMLMQVEARNYNPPKRERILEWQHKQEFPICPNSDDPRACNVYAELQFPEGIYDQIEEFWEERAEDKRAA
jgi:DNA primase large subunit